MTEDDKRPAPGLTAAYGLRGAEDSRALYADWAGTYDSGFAADMDYQLPRAVAQILVDVLEGAGPVLDVGAGTGLVAQSLPEEAGLTIDALDISPQMLAVAAQKRLYRRYIEGDLTGRLEIASGAYGALVSAGTFTHGHVGPDALDELLRIAQPGAWFVLTINSEHFVARGFEAKFAALEPDIQELAFRQVPIYGQSEDANHGADEAHVAVFRKRG